MLSVVNTSYNYQLTARLGDGSVQLLRFSLLQAPLNMHSGLLEQVALTSHVILIKDADT
jgi:hypothetical protein